MGKNHQLPTPQKSKIDTKNFQELLFLKGPVTFSKAHHCGALQPFRECMFLVGIGVLGIRTSNPIKLPLAPRLQLQPTHGPSCGRTTFGSFMWKTSRIKNAAFRGEKRKVKLRIPPTLGKTLLGCPRKLGSMVSKWVISPQFIPHL